MHSLPLAFISNGMELAVIMALSGMGLGLVFGALGMYFQHRRRALWHETARIALEKGQPIPEPSPDSSGWNPSTTSGPAASEHARQNRVRGMLVGGLINIAVGVGMFVAFRQMPGLPAQAAYFGAVPAFIGVALMLGAIVDSVLFRQPPADR
jgi:hypothetical protein